MSAKEPTPADLWERAGYLRAAYSAASDADASAAADAYAAYVDASAAAYAASAAAYAASAAYAAADAAAADASAADKYLNLSASLALKILRELNSPGVSLLTT